MTGRQNGCNREDRAAHSEVKITTTLIAVVITFLICQLVSSSDSFDILRSGNKDAV